MTARRTPRRFEHQRAKREAQRAFLSLSGASGGGKTKSAIELAQGLVSVTGGKVFVVDTENGRAKKYAPPPGQQASPMDAPPEGKTYDFEHVDFQPPFDPDSYLDALRHCEANGAGAVIFDSMSHEHAGEGGRLDSHDKIVGDDGKKNYAAWRPNSDARNRLLWGGFFRSPCHIILCFRAKDKTEQRGKAILDMGFTPIGGDDFIFEADASILFMPQASGVPTWKSDLRGEAKAIKLPGEFRGILDDGRAISWRHGRRLAEWLNAGGALARPAQGSGPAPLSPQRAADQTQPPTDAGPTSQLEGPAPSSSEPPIDDGDGLPGDRGLGRDPYSDAPRGREAEYNGRVYDSAWPCQIEPVQPIMSAEEKPLKAWAALLRFLIQHAPDDDTRHRWRDENAADLLRLTNRSQALHGYAMEFLPKQSPPADPDHKQAAGSEF